ncbi:MAG: SprT family zinc-dependent metalloprotease [Kiritimatiellia bacterium]
MSAELSNTTIRVHSCPSVVTYGTIQIEYQLLRVKRKTLEIAVRPDSTIVVKAPEQADIALIETKIIKRARWILRQLNYFMQYTPKTPDRCYINGESHLYLGKQYRLKLAAGTENSVKLSRGFLHLTLQRTATPSAARTLLNQWYLEKARLQFAESMDRCWQKFSGRGIAQPKLAIKRMQKRWGSLSNKCTITLNTDLIKAPKECIDYVVTHELCHLIYQDHGPEFYRLLESVIPGWKKIKDKLEITIL